MLDLDKLAELVSLPYSCGRFTCYSNGLNYFSVTFPRYYKNVYVNSFSDSYTLEFFVSRMLSFDLIGFPIYLPSLYFFFLFLVTPCLVIAVQGCTKWIPIKKNQQFHIWKKKQRKCTQNSIFNFEIFFWTFYDIKQYICPASYAISLHMKYVEKILQKI